MQEERHGVGVGVVLLILFVVIVLVLLLFLVVLDDSVVVFVVVLVVVVVLVFLFFLVIEIVFRFLGIVFLVLVDGRGEEGFAGEAGKRREEAGLLLRGEAGERSEGWDVGG